ncbi:MAG: type II secretion system GspH family protein [Muribaculaceae bacterium]|nr:type II secretion system GspH family protein [Roseburia sp.]MCM1430492.1 type II secretion system GspH family protein [Muribaculaceae bacterium]MCM1493165.1 type II secretion system GspH family protein [Muribaculaceae bacterium]
MKKNAGFSLIELVVVIAIMALLTTGVVNIVLSQSDWYCRKAADEISTALSETRAQALAKANAWMELKYDSTNGYVISTSYSKDVVLGDHFDVTFESKPSGSTTGTDYDVKTTPLIISYNRGSGAFTYRISSVTVGTYDDGSRSAVYNYASGNEYCTKITVSNGKSTYELTLYPETGKHDKQKL